MHVIFLTISDGSPTSIGRPALVNGTASHALDYDDVHFAFLGHPTAPVLPAVLAVAEHDGRNGGDHEIIGVDPFDYLFAVFGEH